MIDASIPLNGGNRPDPIRDVFAQIQEHKLGQLKQQVLGQEIIKGQHALSDREELRTLLAGGAQGQDLVNQLTRAGHLDKAGAYQKQLDEHQARGLELQSKFGSLLKQELEAASSNPTEANIIGRIDRLAQITGQNLDHEKAAVYEARGNHELLQKYLGGHILGLKKMLGENNTIDAGGEFIHQNTDPFGKITVTGTTPKTQSPDSVASNEIAKGNLAVNQANLELARQRLEFDKNGGKLTFDSKRGMMINPATGEATPVTQNGHPIGSDTQGEGVASAFKAATESLERLKAHPGTDTALGLASMFPTLGGTKAADFEAQLDAFKSQVFLPMVQSIKGMGALSDAEGKKLATAIGALSLSMSKKDFLDAATRIERDLRDKYRAATGKDLAIGTNGLPEQKRFNSMPDPASFAGKRIQADDGIVYKSNGKKWIRE